MYYLTNRELEICKLLAQGMGNIEIADTLYISKHTVKAYISIILDRLSAKNRTEAAYIIGREKLIEM